MGRISVLFCFYLFVHPLSAATEDLRAYGLQMCADVGISPDECTLLTKGAGVSQGPRSTAIKEEAVEQASVRQSKTATLAEHGRRLCEEEGVALQECMALPAELRTAGQTPPAGGPSPFGEPVSLTAADQPFFAAPSRVNGAPLPRARPVVRNAGPPPRGRLAQPFGYPVPARFQTRPEAYAALPPLEAYRGGVREAMPPADPFAPRSEAFRGTVRLADPPLDRDILSRETSRDTYWYDGPYVDRYIPPPEGDLDRVFFTDPWNDRLAPATRAYRETASPWRWSVDRSRLGSVEDFGYLRQPDGFDAPDIYVRCLRSVRYSAPPSYRYVACGY